MLREEPLRHLLRGSAAADEGAGGLHDVPPPAVVEGHGQRHPRLPPVSVARSSKSRASSRGMRRVGDAEEAAADAAGEQQRRVLPHHLPDQAHQVVHLGARPVPVLGGEGVQAEPLHPGRPGCLDGVDDGGLGRLVARRARQRTPLGPPAVAVHHARHMPGDRIAPPGGGTRHRAGSPPPGRPPPPGRLPPPGRPPSVGRLPPSGRPPSVGRLPSVGRAPAPAVHPLAGRAPGPAAPCSSPRRSVPGPPLPCLRPAHHRPPLPAPPFPESYDRSCAALGHAHPAPPPQTRPRAPSDAPPAGLWQRGWGARGPIRDPVTLGAYVRVDVRTRPGCHCRPVLPSPLARWEPADGAGPCRSPVPTSRAHRQPVRAAGGGRRAVLPCPRAVLGHSSHRFSCQSSWSSVLVLRPRRPVSRATRAAGARSPAATAERAAPTAVRRLRHPHGDTDAPVGRNPTPVEPHRNTGKAALSAACGRTAAMATVTRKEIAVGVGRRTGTTGGGAPFVSRSAELALLDAALKHMGAGGRRSSRWRRGGHRQEPAAGGVRRARPAPRRAPSCAAGPPSTSGTAPSGRSPTRSPTPTPACSKCSPR